MAARTKLKDGEENHSKLERKLELLEQEKAKIHLEIKDNEDVMKKQPETIAGIMYINKLREKDLNERILPGIRSLKKEMEDVDLETKLAIGSISDLEPRFNRFQMCMEEAELHPSLDPALPPLPLATELEGDTGCPYCGRSFRWEGQQLPIVLAECSHRYHIPCLSYHLR